MYGIQELLLRLERTSCSHLLSNTWCGEIFFLILAISLQIPLPSEVEQEQVLCKFP